MRACFFTTSNFDQVRKEQYTYADYCILKDIGFDVRFVCAPYKIPLDCDLYYSWWASGSVFPMMIAKLANKPNIVVAGGNEAIPYRDSMSNNPHGYLASGCLKRSLTRATLKHSTAVIAVSNYMVAGLKSLGCDAPHVIHNCVDTLLFRPDYNVKKEFITTSFRMDHIPTLIKRGENFIKAAAILIKEYAGLKFLIIGHKGDAYPNLRKLCKLLGISDSVIFVGAINNSEVVGYLQKSICFVQPSDTETFGVAVAEAMSVGCPVVVSRRGALFEVASDNGIYVDQNSPESIANGVKNVFNMNSDDLSNLSNKSIIHIKENFSYERRKVAIQDLVSSILT